MSVCLFVFFNEEINLLPILLSLINNTRDQREKIKSFW